MPPKATSETKTTTDSTESKGGATPETTPTPDGASSGTGSAQRPPAAPPPPPPPSPQGDSGAGAELAALKRRHMQLQGEHDAVLSKLEVVKAEKKAAVAELEALRSRMQSESKSTLPDLDDDSYELLESVTVTQRGNKAAGHARKGDVVTLGDHELVQRRVGERARVFPVDRQMLEELGGLGLLIER